MNNAASCARSQPHDQFGQHLREQEEKYRRACSKMASQMLLESTLAEGALAAYAQDRALISTVLVFHCLELSKLRIRYSQNASANYWNWLFGYVLPLSPFTPSFPARRRSHVQVALLCPESCVLLAPRGVSLPSSLAASDIAQCRALFSGPLCGPPETSLPLTTTSVCP